MIDVGKTILHYKILEKLGEGGMGIVYKAEDQKLKRVVALKFLPDYLIGKLRTRTRLEREAQAAASLNHPNICTIHGFHETEKHVFIVMEYIKGETLEEILNREGPIPQQKAIQIITQVAEGLVAAHQKGIIHRDIKSDNIMLTKDGRVVLMDFGLAKLENTPTLTRTKSPMGTVGYMSPELVKGEKVGYRTDLWSLGVVLFEMLTGVLPFDKDTDVATMYSIIGDGLPKLTKYNSDVSGSLQYICTTLLEKDITMRYQQADDVLKDLKQSIKGSKTKLIFRKVQRNHKKIFVAIFLILAVVYFANYYYQAKINIPPWLKKDAKLVRLTSESGMESGRISPNGKYLAYKDSEGYLSIKNLATDVKRRLAESNVSTFRHPVWSPNNNYIAYISNSLNAISIVDINNKHIRVLFENKFGKIYHINWSPDGQKIAYFATILGKEDKTELNLIKIDGSDNRRLITNVHNFIVQTSWYPDGKRLAFYDYDSISGSKNKVIRTIEISDSTISDPIIKVKYPLPRWDIKGITYSSDGKYLLYPDKVENSIEIIALPVKNEGTKASGKPIPITKLAGSGMPFWPSFDKTGKILSYGVYKSIQEIHLSSIDLTDVRIKDNLSAITKSTDYAYDAVWAPDGQKIAFVSYKQFRQDIFLWDRNKKEPVQITFTEEPKKNPKFIPNRSAISYISSDIIWEVTIRGSKKRKIFPENDKNQYKICWYDWGLSPNTLYILQTKFNKRSNIGQLVKISLHEKQTEILIDDISDPIFAEFCCSPNEEFIVIRRDIPGTPNQYLEVLDLNTRKRTKLRAYHADIPYGELSWTPDSKSIIYGAWGTDAVFSIYLTSVISLEHQVLSTRSGTLVRYPGKLSPKGDYLIFYTTSNEADMWLLGGEIKN